jgi:L-lysine exporter family protein LysE/ArgO
VGAAVAGLLTGWSLIVAIGAQNAYVLRLGLTREHVLVAVAICSLADVALIAGGIGGGGGLVLAHAGLLVGLKWFGVAYLVAFALRSFWRARHTGALRSGGEPTASAARVAVTTAAFTFLNPHVYLDTVLLLGSVANQYGSHRWLFGAGAASASVSWFSLLGFGAHRASRVMARPGTWRALDLGIGCIVLGVAWEIAHTTLHT